MLEQQWDMLEGMSGSEQFEVVEGAHCIEEEQVHLSWECGLRRQAELAMRI